LEHNFTIKITGLKHPIHRFFLSRWTVAALLAAYLASFAIAAIVPQQPISSETARSWLGVLSRWIGLDRVFSTWWFALLSLLFCVSLGLSAVEQFRLARRRMQWAPPPHPPEAAPLVPLSEDAVVRRLGILGYRRAGHDGFSLYRKSNAGHWGGSLLHCGLLCAVLFSALYVLTEYRVIVRTIQDRSVSFSDGAVNFRTGRFSSRAARMAGSFELKRIDPRYSSTGVLQTLESTVLISDKSGAVSTVRVAVSDKAYWRGLRVYQNSGFGTVFMLHIQSLEDGSVQEIPLWMPLSGVPDRAAYLGPLKFGRYTLKAKYFARKDRRGLFPLDPELVLKLMDEDKVVAETSLERGHMILLGPYLVTCADYRLWSDILLEGSRGVSGIFAGFFLIIAGGGLAYFVVPVEVAVYNSRNGCRLLWHGGRLADPDAELRRILEV
jgi:hypothetical protein